MKDTIIDILCAATLLIGGAALGIGLCKFCPGFVELVWRGVV